MRSLVQTARICALLLAAAASAALAQEGQAPRPPADGAAPLVVPRLSLAPDDQSVYAPRAPAREEEGINAGGVNFDLTVRYMTDNVYRGVDRSEVGGHEDAPNLQVDTRVTFNLGKFPHPFVGTFVNVYGSDPVSRFQEVRPYFGINWLLRPFEIEVGNITYIFPERDPLNTGEVYAKITFDDSWLFQTRNRILTPYVLAAYDYDKYNGWYLEAGLRHDLPLENTGLTISFIANMAYVLSNPQFSTTPHGRDDGLQHYEIGLIGTYSLNKLFNVSTRYGTWTLEGYLFYTDRSSTFLRADTQIYGGAGLGFRY